MGAAIKRHVAIWLSLRERLYVKILDPVVCKASQLPEGVLHEGGHEPVRPENILGEELLDRRDARRVGGIRTRDVGVDQDGSQGAQDGL